MSPQASFQVRLRSRVLGLAVLVLSAVGLVVLAGNDASPWSWLIVSTLGLAALVASLANFGDRFDVDDQGITHLNTLTARVGWPRVRRATWAEIRHAIDQDGDTIFLEVDGQRRWVLDQLDGQEHLRLILADRGIPMTNRTRPRLTSWGRGGSEAPR
jgi:hypothetical protein